MRRVTATAVAIIPVIAVAVFMIPSAMEYFELANLFTPNNNGLPPRPIYWLAIGALDWLERLQSALFPANLQLMKLMAGNAQTATIYAAVSTGLIDAMGEKAKTLTEISEIVTSNRCDGSNDSDGCDAVRPRMHRILRTLETLQIVRSSPSLPNDDGRWSLTRLGKHLLSDHPSTMMPAALFFGDYLHNYISDLPHTILTGKSAHERVYDGLGQWDYYKKYPEEGQKFDRFMTSFAETGVNKAIADDYTDFGLLGTLVELGCGEGTLLDFILRTWTQIHKGVCFDQPDVILRAEKKWAERETMKAGRVQLLSGSFFEASSIPGGDAYMMRMILHDWNDNESIKILKNIKQASMNGKISLHERGFNLKGWYNFARHFV